MQNLPYDIMIKVAEQIDPRHLALVGRTVYNGIHKTESYTFFTTHEITERNCIANGNLNIIKYVFESGLVQFTTKSLIFGAKWGRLDILIWLYDNVKLKFPSEMIYHAAAAGHLDVVKWVSQFYRLKSSGGQEIIECTWQSYKLDTFDIGRARYYFGVAMDYAAAAGHLHIVQWLHYNRPEGCTVRAMTDAAAAGHMDVVQWLHDNRTEGCVMTTMIWAARCGHDDMVKWIYANEWRGTEFEAIEMAIEEDCLDILKWIWGPTIADIDGVLARAERLAERLRRPSIVRYLRSVGH